MLGQVNAFYTNILNLELKRALWVRMHYQFNYILNYKRNSFMLCFGGIINKMPLVTMLYLNFVLSVKNL